MIICICSFMRNDDLTQYKQFYKNESFNDKN